MPADLGLRYGTPLSTPTMQVKGLWVYTMSLKLDAPGQVSKAYNWYEIHKSFQPRWQKKSGNGADIALQPGLAGQPQQ